MCRNNAIPLCRFFLKCRSSTNHKDVLHKSRRVINRTDA